MLHSEIERHAAQILARYEQSVASDPRFTNPRRLIDRVREICRHPPAHLAELRALHEAHNELVVADALLRKPIQQLTYEPLEDLENKTVDFLVRTDEHEDLLVDVKTISPEPRDRWDQFERGRAEGWIPDSLDLSAAWMGGELWHSAFTARSRMLEYTLELEAKLPRYQARLSKVFAVMAFCGNGFSWNRNELEDFVSFYFTGRHRSDDSFASMERHAIKERGTRLGRSINRFAYFERPSTHLDAHISCWNVQPPEDPSLG